MPDTRTVSQWIFRTALIVALLSAVVLLIRAQWGGAAKFVVVVLLVLGASRTQVPARFAAAFAVFLLLATWGYVLHWYADIWQFDTVVHVLTPGSLAAVSYFVLVQAGLFPDARGQQRAPRSWAVVVWVAVVGVTWAVLWEYYEWVFEQFKPQDMIVGYTDTIGDLLAGMLGSTAAGLFVWQWARGNPEIIGADGDAGLDQE